MKKWPLHTYIQFFLIVTLIRLSPIAHANPSNNHSWDGLPSFYGTTLPISTYEPVTVYELKHPELIWVNRNWLRNQGYTIDQSGPIPKDLQEKVTQAFGWSVKHPGDPESAFTGRTKTIYADRYGGPGLGVHHCSGRAASQGDYQIKGIGITPLRMLLEREVFSDGLKGWLKWLAAKFGHRNGRASVEEAVREPVSSELNAAELPYGSNEVVAVIKSGLKARTAQLLVEDAALIVRFDPLRPAHLVKNISQAGTPESLQKNNQALIDVWNSPPWQKANLLSPQFSSELNSGVALQEAILTYIERLARQQASAFTKGIFHVAINTSNTELSGRSLDFGTQTYNSTFRALKVQKETWAMADGDPEYIVGRAVKDLLETARTILPPDKALHVPTFEEAHTHFLTNWSDEIRNQLLELTGISREVWKEGIAREYALGLSKTLEALVTLEQKIPLNAESHVDLKTLLVELSVEKNPTTYKVRDIASKRIPDRALLDSFVVDYTKLRNAGLDFAIQNKVQPDAWNRLIYERCRRMLAPRSEIETKTWGSNFKKFMNSIFSKKKEISIQDYVDNQVNRNRRFEYLSEPFETVISHGTTPDKKNPAIAVFNAKWNQIEIREILNGKFSGTQWTVTNWVEAVKKYNLSDLPAIRHEQPRPPLVVCFLKILGFKNELQ